MLRDKLKKIALLLFMTALALGTGELILRKFCTFCNYMESNKRPYISPYSTFTYNGWVHGWGINSQHDYKRPEFSDSLNIFQTNSVGLRDIEHKVEKDSGTFRIVCLGDSFTEGVGAAVEYSYVQQLQTKLNEPGTKKYEIINGGVSGADPVFAYILLKKRLLQFKPDLVLLAINDTDIEDLIIRGGMERFQPDNQLQFAPRPFGEWLFSYSHIARGIMLTFLNYDWYALTPKTRAKREHKATEDLQKVILELQQLAEKENFKLATFYHPTNEWAILRNKYKYKGFHSIGQFIRSKEIPFFDITSHIIQTEPISEEEIKSWFWEIDKHCNRTGYAVFAESLVVYLSNLGY